MSMPPAGTPPPQGPPPPMGPLGPGQQGPPYQGPPQQGPPMGPSMGPPGGPPAGWPPASGPGGPRKSKGPVIAIAIIAAVVVLAAAVGGGLVLWKRFAGDGSSQAGPEGTATSDATSGPGPSNNADAPAGVVFGAESGSGKPGMGNGIGQGAEEAPTVVELYIDFYCPHCQDLETSAGKLLREKVESGQIRIVRYPMSFMSPASKTAAQAFACASDQDTSGRGEASAKVADRLFQTIPQQQANAVADEQLLLLGQGLPKPDAFTSCVREGTYLAWVESISAAAGKRGVSGTPAVFVNGEEASLTPTQSGDWAATLEAALG